MEIKLLYFDDCPSWQQAEANLQEALDALKVDADVKKVRVETSEQAQETRFVGSPTLRVDGEDLFPATHDDYALGCRIYQTADGASGSPTTKMISEALQEHISE